MTIAKSLITRLSLVLPLLALGFTAKIASAQPEEATASPKFVTLHAFDGTSGTGPNTLLVQATNGDFYGSTSGGAPNCSFIGECGTIFKITPSGAVTTLYNFCDPWCVPTPSTSLRRCSKPLTGISMGQRRRPAE